MARPRGFPHRSRSQRKTEWIVGPNMVDGSLSATGKLLFTNGVIITGGKVTIVRTRGLVSLYNNSASVVGAGFKGAVGIGVVTALAFTAGAGSMPGPLTDVGWDGWLWHDFFDVRSITATIGDGVNAVSTVQRLPVDSKAMRIVEAVDQIIFGMVEVTEQTSANLEIQADTRMLVKLG